MHVIVATDGSRQSLVAARQFMAFADVAKLEEVSGRRRHQPARGGAVRERARRRDRRRDDPTRLSFREEAHAATGVVMAELQAWGATACTGAS